MRPMYRHTHPYPPQTQGLRCRREEEQDERHNSERRAAHGSPALHHYSSHTYFPISAASVAVTGEGVGYTIPTFLEITDGFALGALSKTAWGLTINTSFTLSSAQSYRYITTRVVNDTIRFSETMKPKAIYGLTCREVVAFKSAVSVTYPITVTSGLTLAAQFQLALGAVITDRLMLHEFYAASTQYHVAVSDHMTLRDALGRFFGGAISDVMAFGDGAIYKFVATAEVTDVLALTDSVAPTLVMRVDIHDTMDFNDAELLRMIYTGTISDAIDIQVGYAEPSGSFTTWAINTRTNAVSEYHNWQFNSFARLNGRYIAASKDGVFELAGDTDAGAAIPTDVRGGFIQPGGSRFTAIKCAYLGMNVTDHSTGVRLKLITGDGSEFTYRVNPLNMRTTRVNIGKGLRSRYYSWELLTDGVDFSLDTIEFVPLVAQRRV